MLRVETELLRQRLRVVRIAGIRYLEPQLLALGQRVRDLGRIPSGVFLEYMDRAEEVDRGLRSLGDPQRRLSRGGPAGKEQNQPGHDHADRQCKRSLRDV